MFSTLSRKKILCLLTVLIIICAGSLYYVLIQFRQIISSTHSAIEMGSAVSLTLYQSKGYSSGQKIKNSLNEESEAILSLIEDLDRSILSWRSPESETARFNKSSEPFPVSQILADAIRLSLQIEEDTNGALDITLRPLIELWGIENNERGTEYTPPSEEQIAEVSGKIGYRHLHLLSDSDKGEALSSDIPNLELDLGSIGKGYALDLAAADLDKFGVDGAIIAVGGSVLAYGSKGTDSYSIGIRNPEGDPYDYLGILSVNGEAGQKTFISTSGGYEKFAVSGDTVYEHIIDGRTLHPVISDLYSVTVVTQESGLISDGLSTACYIHGLKDSLTLLERYQAEVIFVTRDGIIYLTDGLLDSFSLVNNSYTIQEIP